MFIKKAAFSVLAIVLLAGAEVSLAQPNNASLEDSMPSPVNSNGRVLLSDPAPTVSGVWTPVFGIFDPIAPLETVPFQPWSKSLYDARQWSHMPGVKYLERYASF